MKKLISLSRHNTLLLREVTPLKVWADLPGDCDDLNDTTKKQMLGIPTYVVPYIDNFDAPNLYTEWYTYGQWEHGVTTSTTINAPYQARIAGKPIWKDFT